MPRKKPLIESRSPKKSNIKYQQNFEYCKSIPCFKCNSFMFLVTAVYEDGRIVDEMECFQCKKLKRLGKHQPHRAKLT